MAHIHMEFRDKVALIRLTRGTTNPIDGEVVAELGRAVSEVRTRARGMVLTGGDKFFSIGLDLPALLKLDRAGMLEFFTSFNQVCLDIFTLPTPTAAAMIGHATAGGTILALTCDFRVVGRGKNLMGLNETRIGVPVPYLADLMLRQIVGDRAATDMTYSGRLLGPDEAKTIGLADETGPPEEVEALALNKIAALADLSPGGLAAVKATRVESVLKRYEANGRQINESFMEVWEDPEVQALLAEAAQKF